VDEDRMRKMKERKKRKTEKIKGTNIPIVCRLLCFVNTKVFSPCLPDCALLLYLPIPV
jgi:hypothetical protein